MRSLIRRPSRPSPTPLQRPVLRVNLGRGLLDELVAASESMARSFTRFAAAVERLVDTAEAERVDDEARAEDEGAAGDAEEEAAADGDGEREAEAEIERDGAEVREAAARAAAEGAGGDVTEEEVAETIEEVDEMA